jgi:hypothetical protein
MGSKIAVIDTENGSSNKYASIFNFDVAILSRYRVEDYCKAITAASAYDVLIIDSLTHAWQELLQEVDRIAKAKCKGNTWAAWADVTPMHKQLVQAILSCPVHVIATMRSKTDWVVEGKRPVQVSLAPEQGKDIEYEFDMLGQMTDDNGMLIRKDRTGKYQGQIIDKPTDEFGKSLIDWLADGISDDDIHKAIADIIDDGDIDIDLKKSKLRELYNSTPNNLHKDLITAAANRLAA